MGQGETGGGPEGIGTAPTPEDAVQVPRTIRPLPRWAVLLLAALLVGSWSTWAVHAYRAELRIVTMDELRSDLSAGIVRSYDVVTAMRSQRAWPPPDETSYDTAQTPDPGAPGTTGPGAVTAAYHVDSWVAPIRIVQVVTTEAGSDVVDVLEVIQELEAAGIPPRDRVPAEVRQANPRQSAEVSGLVLGLLALMALLAIRPTRGTRWFWFWVFGAPLGLGVLAHVVVECLLPKRSSPPAEVGRRDGRLIGVVGFLVQVGAKFLIPF